MSYLKTNIKEVRFNRKICLHDISLNIKKSEIVCIVGFSGCGKTSLLNILSGYLTKQHFIGNIFLEGTDITSFTSYKRRFHSVRHNLFLFDDETVSKNILFGYRDDNTDTEDIRNQRLKYLLGIFHITELANRKIYELSQGQKNRVAIARSIIDKPSALFLDEAFAHIDYYVKNMIIRDLLAILRIENITTIFVTHNVDEMHTLPDSIYVIESKTIREIGSFNQLNAKPQTYSSACLISQCNEIICQIISENSTSFYLKRGDIMFRLDKKKIEHIKNSKKDISLFFKKNEVEIVENISDNTDMLSCIEYKIIRIYSIYNEFFAVISTRFGNFDICTKEQLSTTGRMRIKNFTLVHDYLFNR